ncbi:TIGR00266 family protein [Vibrio owensii]|uniref:TIGR00266 family protein n=1 Tax=Vibrio owensii TaxID=696485 RepID=UPI003CC5B513
MKCHEIEITVHGTGMPFCTVELDPGEVVIAEAGALMFHESGIEYETKLGDGSNPNAGLFSSLWNAGSRMISGDSLFLTHFKNKGHVKRMVSFSATLPGDIQVVDMKEVGGSIICNRDSFLCAALGTKISAKADLSIRGLFGEGFFLQQIEGDGNIALNSGGNIQRVDLDNDEIFVDPSCLVAYQENGIRYEVIRNGGLKSMLFSGEGLALVKLSGTGSVFLQTMPFERFVNKIASALPPRPCTHS